MRTITVMIKDDFDPTLGADITEAVEDFEQLLQVEFEEDDSRVGIKKETLRYVIEVLEDYRTMTDDARQQGEEHTAIDETIDELLLKV